MNYISMLAHELRKLVLAILCVIVLVTTNNVYANDMNKSRQDTDTYVNNRDLTIIISKMMGVTDNMVNSEYINDIPNYIDENIINTYSEYEKGYYNLLYQVYEEYSIIERANKFFTVTNMSYSGISSNSSFMYAALRTQGIIGPSGNSNDYIYIRAREYNYLPRELKGQEIFDYANDDINKERLKQFILAFLKSKVSYYYDETEFLKGNTKPIYKSKKCTYFDLLNKKFGFKNLDTAYNYIVSNIESGSTVKRIKMIKELNKIIGYTDEEYNALKEQGKIVLPYHYSNSDVCTDNDIKAVAFARFYYLSEYSYDEAWRMKPKRDAGSEEFFFNEPWIEAEGSRSYSIKAQEFIKGIELKDCLTKCLDYKNIKYDIDYIFKDISLDNLISEKDFNSVLQKASNV